MNTIGAPLLLLAALICNAAANILVKYGMTRRLAVETAERAASAAQGGAAGTGGEGTLRLTSWMAGFLDPYFLAGIFCFVLNLVAYSLALKYLRLSIAYPVMVSGGYAIILLASWFLFREKLTLTQYGGIGFIVVGLWMAVR